jgi:hypothetical protein
MCITFSLLYAGVYVEREKVTPAAGLGFSVEEKIIKLLGSYLIVDCKKLRRVAARLC